MNIFLAIVLVTEIIVCGCSILKKEILSLHFSRIKDENNKHVGDIGPLSNGRNRQRKKCFVTKKWKVPNTIHGKTKKHICLLGYELNELSGSAIWKTQNEIQKELKNKDIKEILKNRIYRILSIEELNKFNSFSYIYSKEEIKTQIECLCTMINADNEKGKDKRNRSNLKLPPLFGVPIAIKDNIVTKGIPTKGGSAILSSYIPSYDSTVVKKLKQNGAIIIGKTNMDEFAMGNCTTNVKNPFNEVLLSCGGSSGGSGSLVGSQMINCSVGSDTGGSIRTPAALCGCIGLKPTHGRISRYGLIPYNEETDVIGLIVNNVYDVSILMDVLCGPDEHDLTTFVETEKRKDEKKKEQGEEKDYHMFPPNMSKHFTSSVNGCNDTSETSTGFFSSLKEFSCSMEFKSGQPLKNLKLCYLSDDYLEKYCVDNIIKANYKKVIKALKKLGCAAKRVKLSNLVDVCYVYYLYSMSVAVSNLSRFDKLSYTAVQRGVHAQSIEEQFPREVGKGKSVDIAKLRAQLIGETVLARIIGGSIISQHLDKLKIRDIFISVQQRLRKSLHKIFQRVDCIVLPSYPQSGILKENANYKDRIDRITEETGNKWNKDMVNNKHIKNSYMIELFSVIASVSGFPSIVIPSGNFTKQFNEPLSFQVVSNKFDEMNLLKIALSYMHEMDVNEKLRKRLRK